MERGYASHKDGISDQQEIFLCILVIDHDEDIKCINQGAKTYQSFISIHQLCLRPIWPWLLFLRPTSQPQLALV